MAMFSETVTKECGKNMWILTVVLLSLCMLAYGDIASDSSIELLARDRRAVVTDVLQAPNAVPENANSSVILVDLTSRVPDRNYLVTGNSAGVQNMFLVTNGKLTLNSNLAIEERKLFDYERYKTFEVTVNATNQTDSSDVVILTVLIPLSDINDEIPTITNMPRPFYATLSQNAAPNTVVYTVTVRDVDTTADVDCRLDQVVLSGQSVVQNRFQMSPVSGGTGGEKQYNIITLGTGSFQAGAEYTVKITAWDKNNVVGTQQITDNIVVRIGTRPPQFYELTYRGEIYESVPTTTQNWVLSQGTSNPLEIKVLQFQPDNDLNFDLLDQNGAQSQLFGVVRESGVQKIRNIRPIDYETLQAVSLTVRVTEANTRLTSTAEIIINIIDENDNPPSLAPQYSVTVKEDATVTTTILSGTASDRDSGLNGELTFSISNSTNFDVKTLPNKSFAIIVKSPLDYDTGTSNYQFTLTVSDKGKPPLSSNSLITVYLQNVNDNPPTIDNSTSVISLIETAAVNDVVTIVQASDIDGDTVKFYFAGKVSRSGIFTIRDTNGLISTNALIPKEVDSYNLVVIAVDDGSCCGDTSKVLTSTATFTVTITDINVNKPDFEKCQQYDTTARVKELAPVGAFVIQVSARDDDRGENGKVLYRLESQDTKNELFQIDRDSGNITVKGNIIRGLDGFAQVTVVAYNPSPHQVMEGICTFRVTIIDINNNPPVFSQSVFNITLSSSTTEGSMINQMVATDNDFGPNANITYSFDVNDTETLNTFSINRFNGIIKLEKTLTRPSYTLVVIANDNGIDPGPKTGSAIVSIIVSSQTGPTPEWVNVADNTTYSISENQTVNYIIATLSCRSDNHTELEFRGYDSSKTIAQDPTYFDVVSFTRDGIYSMNLTLRKELDYETQKEHKLTLACQSRTAQVSRKLIFVQINVLDSNDERPELLGQDQHARYTGSVREDADSGVLILRFSANDRDSTEPYRTVTFSLTNETHKELFEIRNLGNNSADLLTAGGNMFDRENLSYYSLGLVAMDGAPKSPPDPRNPLQPNSAIRYIDLNVLDVNDNPPKFSQDLYTFNVSESAFIDDLVGIVKADDPDQIDQSTGLDYRITDGNVLNAFNIRFMTGEIRVAKKLDYEGQDPKIYNLTVVVVDTAQLHSASTKVQIFLLDENDNSPVFEKKVYQVENAVYENDYSVTRENPLFLVTVKATDADISRPQDIRYRLYGTAQTGAEQLFIVDSLSGDVSLIGPLDRDIAPFFYTLTIEAKDEIINPRIGYTEVQVSPMDVNDNAPVFKSQYLSGSVAEHSPNTLVLTVVAEDKDAGPNGTVEYRLSAIQPKPELSAMFFVSKTGDISTTSNVTLLDHETIQQISLVVQAYDQGTPSLDTNATVTITVLDINDQSPFFEKPLYSASMSEAQTSGPVITIQAIDLDSDPKFKQLKFELRGNASDLKFFMVQPTDNPTVISVAQPVDYEQGYRLFIFILHVTDGEQSHENTTEVRITVLDANDNAPEFVDKEKSVTLVEEEPPLKVIANFTAIDKDEGLNGEFEYSIIRASDPRYEFYVYPKSGEVITRKRLDREVHQTINVLIMAKDKGEIPLSSTGTLSVTLTDINDNPPSFADNYRPVVPENVDHNNFEVQVIHATDPDTQVNGPPFGFSLPSPCNDVACKFFSLTFNPDGDNTWGTATIRTSSRFDREERKYYYLPIVMWDRRDKANGSLTTTNTLTITIGDENDNVLAPGNQNILVYNYEGHFGEIEIGRVYANDPDDWDLPDKSFSNFSPKDMEAYFSVDQQTGMITKKSGVPLTNGNAPYQFTVDVYDKKYSKTVTCSVSVTVQLLTDEAVRNSGGVRLAGVTAEEFVKPMQSGTPNSPPTSKYDQFRQTVAAMLGYPGKDNIEIVSMTDVDGGFLDVRFSAHASPYVKPSQGESAIMLNLIKFEQEVGVKVQQVPINLCMEEVYDDGCYNLLNVSGEPQLVNSNGTSYVVMKTTLSPQAGCVDSMFPDPVECRGDYCFNGGTCLKDDWGKLSCACLPGFDGPRCQQRRHSFDGNSAAFYDGLSVCSAGRTSIDFITTEEDGLIMFSGPITAIDLSQEVHDYLILELKGGYPYLRLNLGTNEVSILMTGKSASGVTVMNKLNDGQWHHIDIDRDNMVVTLTVDHCNSASSTNGTVLDWAPCRQSATVPGPDVLLNVKSLLQLGGRYPNTQVPPYPTGVTSKGFKGCLRNLVHNTKLYDLYYKAIPSWNSGSNRCPKEDAICGQGTAQPACGVNATCEGRWDPDGVSLCRCNPGWYGDKCSKEAPVRDLRGQSYFIWQLNPTLIAATRRVASFQMMFRTRQTTGALFVLTNADARSILLELVDGKLSLSYDMGQGKTDLVLSNAPANIGQWTVVRVERYGNEFLLSMDGGEGRYYTYQITAPDLGVFFEVQPRVTAGAVVTSAGQISSDLQSTCVRDIRFNDKWLPLTKDQNNDADAGATLTQSQSVQDGCERNNCDSNCPPGQYCYNLWETSTCRCNPGSVLNGDVCVSLCDPNPCFKNVPCSVDNGKVVCACPPEWTGQYCDAMKQEVAAGGLGGGEIAAIVIAILVLLILIILLLIFLLTRRRSEKEKIVEVDPDDDFIRENVMFYDEEGAGEEDHAAYDITLLQRPFKETSAKPVFAQPTENEIRARNAPRLDRPDIAPSLNRPDVGSFIKDRIKDTENEEPNTDSTREFNFEGGNSDAGSLSSLNTSSSGGSQDYDYLSEWGPKFAKLADMYGAGQNQNV